MGVFISVGLCDDFGMIKKDVKENKVIATGNDYAKQKRSVSA